MRLLFGIVLGALLVVGGAYVHDTNPRMNLTVGERPLVNWDVVNAKWHSLTERASTEWHKLRVATRSS